MEITREDIAKVLKTKLNWDTEATVVIKEKIAHYKKMGNKNKLGIYEAKLKDKKLSISRLKRMIPRQ